MCTGIKGIRKGRISGVDGPGRDNIWARRRKVKGWTSFCRHLGLR
jgi:hypothetical protein